MKGDEGERKRDARRPNGAYFRAREAQTTISIEGILIVRSIDISEPLNTRDVECGDIA